MFGRAAYTVLTLRRDKADNILLREIFSIILYCYYKISGVRASIDGILSLRAARAGGEAVPRHAQPAACHGHHRVDG